MRKILLFTLIFISIKSFSQIIDDSTAIKNVLIKESATWRSGDVKGHTECWYVQPYTKILVSTPGGKCYDVPPETMIHPSAAMVGQGGSSENSNYKFSIHGNYAWVSHDERSMAKNGTVTYSHEIRMLEKINDQWKLVAQSIHIYNP